MRTYIKKLSYTLILALMITGIFPGSIMAAQKKNYVKSMSVSPKTMTIGVGKSKTFLYKIKTKGKASKKVTIKASNANIKISMQKGKVKVLAKKAGTSKITVTSKGKTRKGKRVKKTVAVKILAENAPENNSGQAGMPAKTAMPNAKPAIPTPPNGRPGPTRVPATPSMKVTERPRESQKPDQPGQITTKPEVTKSEWVAALMNVTEYSVQRELFESSENGKISYSFTDISEDNNADIMETAAKYGIIPKTGGRFNPNDAADREFLAVTSVRAVGFAANGQKVNCYDKAKLKYEKEDAVAIELKLLKLVNGSFLPEQPITKEEQQNTVHILSNIMDGRRIDENHVNVVKYDKDVVCAEKLTDYDVSEQNGKYTVVVPVGTSLDGIDSGGKMLLPATKQYVDGLALNVVSREISEDGRYQIIHGTLPDDIMDFVDTVDIQGKAGVSVEGITAVDGVATVDVSTDKAKHVLRSTNKARAKIEDEMDLKEMTKISYEVESLGTTVSFYISKLNYSVDFNRKGVNKIYIGLPNVLAVDTEYKANKHLEEKIGEIKIGLAAGLSANLEVYLEADINGIVTLNLKLSNNIGIQYHDGQFYVEKECKPSFNAVVDADLEAGAKLQLSLYWLEGIKKIFGNKDQKPIYNINTRWGLHGDATLQTRNDEYTSYEKLTCVDLAYYMYGSVGAGTGSVLGEKFGLTKTWVIFDDANSPLKGDMHFENGKVVRKCTYHSADMLLADFASQYSFLCDDTNTHNVNASCNDYFEVSAKTDIQKKPFTYDIDDYDSDGMNELLIVDTKPLPDDLNANNLVITLKMYEAEGGSVRLKAEDGCRLTNQSSDVYFEIPVYETIAQGGTTLYKYLKNDKLVIAAENNARAFLFADGSGFAFAAVTYDGEKFVRIGCKNGGGSSWEEEEIKRYHDYFASIGLQVDVEKVLTANKCIMDYIKNSVVIGRSYNEILENYTIIEKMLENPALYHKIGQVSFSKN